MFRILLILSLLFTLPCLAEENTFLYLHSPDCGYCTSFNPVYEKLVKRYSYKYKFVKNNIDTKDGRTLAMKHRAYYVPLVVVIKNNKATHIPPSCLVDFSCVDKVLQKI